MLSYLLECLLICILYLWLFRWFKFTPHPHMPCGIHVISVVPHCPHVVTVIPTSSLSSSHRPCYPHVIPTLSRLSPHHPFTPIYSPPPQIIKNQLNLDLIKIIQFFLKIYDLLRHPHLWVVVGWMDGLMDRWVNGWVNGWGQVKSLKSNKS